MRCIITPCGGPPEGHDRVRASQRRLLPLERRLPFQEYSQIIGLCTPLGKPGWIMRSPQKVLVTGFPGCGKSTLIEKIVCQIRRPMVGFFTRELREGGQRIGFSIATLDGKRGVLAHRDRRGPPRVGKYGVDLEELERLAMPAMRPPSPDYVVIIDEIGTMECFSSRFRDLLTQLLDSGNDLLASISQRGDRFIERIKARPDVRVIHLSQKNRDALVSLAGLFNG